MSLIKRTFPTFPSLSDLFGEDWSTTNWPEVSWSPAVNVIENGDNFEVEVAAPGLRKEEFDISVENGVLRISGKSEKEAEEKKKNYTRREFSSRSFLNRFTLPENVDGDSIDAKYENGILHLKLKKKDKAESSKKQIAVK
jgi:HSP20 family protein